jgi:hypothetical protein
MVRRIKEEVDSVDRVERVDKGMRDENSEK